MTEAQLGAVLSEFQTLFERGTVVGLSDGELLGRFAMRRDEAAFAALVGRHGPMVLAVCRGVLRTPHDAEDAFQATFLILAGKAAVLRSDSSIGGWLHRVARRVAVHANTDAKRRRARERVVAAESTAVSAEVTPYDDLIPLLHEELARLPEKYRSPLVLCDMEGLTRDEAAGQLGWPSGTVAGRLARGRDLLRARLTRRGVAPAVGALGGLLAVDAFAASVPAGLLIATVAAALSHAAAGASTAGALASGVARVMLRARVRTALLATAAAGVAMTALVVAVLAQQKGAPLVTITGSVEAGGGPVADAEVLLAEGAPGSGRALPSGGGLVSAAPAPPVVLERGRTDAAGRFRIDMPNLDARPEHLSRPLALWISKTGALVGVRTIPDGWPPDAEPLSLNQGRQAPVTLKVLGPDARAIAGAKLAPARVRGLPLPTELADRFTVETDGSGVGTLVATAPDELELVRVIAVDFGTQMVRVPGPEADGLRTLSLSHTGRIDGVVKADDPRATRGLTIRLRTTTDPTDSATGAGGVAEAVTDEEGRFTVSAIATGALGVAFKVHPDLPFRGRFRDHPPIVPGTTTRIEIVLNRAALIRGVVREQGTNTPIAGAHVVSEWDWDAPILLTDAVGRFAGYCPADDRIGASHPAFHYRYYNLDVALGERIPGGVAEFTAKPVELGRGATVEGRVVDAQGKAVPAAAISGYWLRLKDHPAEVSAISDRTGAFRIEGIEPNRKVLLTARHGDATTENYVLATAGEEPITLTVAPAHAIALDGRAVDADGKPVAGAIVTIESLKHDGQRANPVERLRRVTFDDDSRETIVAGADGRFRTPRGLRPDMEYRALVEAVGRVAVSTEWIDAAKNLRTFPDVVLHSVASPRVVEGRIVDRRGAVVAGAVVFQSRDGPSRTQTVSGAEGRFRLPGVFRAPAILFVQGENLRFGGHRIEAGNKPIVLTVERSNDPPGPPMRSLPPLFPRDEEKALALWVIGPDLARIAKHGVTPGSTFLVSAAARLDPAHAVELAKQCDRLPPVQTTLLRMAIARALLEENAAVAFAVAEGMPRPGPFFQAASDALPASEKARKVELLERSLEAGRNDIDPIRLIGLGMVGNRLLDLGETERGQAVLREGQRLADNLAKKNLNLSPTRVARARGWFAPALARIDTAAAFAMAETARSPDRDAFSGLALALADRDPKAAERALGLIKDPSQRSGVIDRVAGRMVVKDPVRARRLSATLQEPLQRAFALGRMATNLAATDPETAAALIDECLDVLLGLAARGHWLQSNAIPLAVSLLPVAERLDAELLRRSFWKVAALRSPPGQGDPNGNSDEAIAELAFGLARYDRAVARLILEPVAQRARTVSSVRASAGLVLFAAATMIDPAWAVALIDALPDEPSAAANRLRPKEMVRHTVADVLAHSPAGRWEYLQTTYTYYRLIVNAKDNEL